MTDRAPLLRNLVIVAGHAPFKESITDLPANPAADEAWVLQPFQRGEPPLYIEHIRRGVELAGQDPETLLVFSGGYTRREAGLRWSEAATYAALARHFHGGMDEGDPSAETGPAARIAMEDFSRDSFENLLFSLGRFQQWSGSYPESVTVVSWEFKAARFDFHRAAIRFPANRFRYEGCFQPRLLDEALKGEAVTMRAYIENRYGASPAMMAKRAGRNPFHRQHGFARCPGLEQFFDFISNPANGRIDFPERLPWED